MTKFIPREKMSKKARKALDLSRRETWAVPPVTRKIENKKHYNRKADKPCIRFEHDGAGFFHALLQRESFRLLQKSSVLLS